MPENGMLTAIIAAVVEIPIAVMKRSPHMSSCIDLAKAIHDLETMSVLMRIGFSLRLFFLGHHAVVEKKARRAPIGIETLMANKAKRSVIRTESTTVMRKGLAPGTGFS
jgi:hypothetical protein